MLPHFLDNLLTDGGEVASPKRQPLFTLRKIPVHISVSVESKWMKTGISQQIWMKFSLYKLKKNVSNGLDLDIKSQMDYRRMDMNST
jgi:hypothetical protein